MTDRTILASNASVYTLAEINIDFNYWEYPKPLRPRCYENDFREVK